MTRPLLLEVFDGGADPGGSGYSAPDFSALASPDPPQMAPSLVDAAPAAPDDGGDAYERGYRAGWDDCETEGRDTRQAVGAELARNLQELGFTFHEARAHVLSGIEPLLSAIVGKVLPRLVSATVGASIVEELSGLVASAADPPVTILVSPASHDLVAGFLSDATALPHKLVAEETLSEWQVFFRLGDHEHQLDLGDVIDRIVARLEAFSDQNEKALKNG